MSIGIFVFAIMGIAGMLPIGIRTQHASIEQSRAVETLREATAAIYSQQLSGTTYSFQNGFPGGAGVTGLQWSYGGSATSLPVFVVPSPDNGGQAMFVRITPPATAGQALGVFMSVASPSSATCAANGTWTNAQGFEETYVSVMPPN